MKTIRFEGYLKELYPEGIKLEADSAAEAIAGLGNFPGFRRSDEVLHQVELPMFQSRDAIYARTELEEILVVPVEQGAGGKKGGILQVIIGVVLIIAAVVVTVISGGALTPLGVGLFLAGASMLLGGIMAMLMPTPKAASIGSEEKSKYIPANKNTVKVGTPIPILFGRRKIWGQFLSFDVDAKNLNETFPDPSPAPTINTSPAAISAKADSGLNLVFSQIGSFLPYKT